jgi:hypothetical protein
VLLQNVHGSFDQVSVRQGCTCCLAHMHVRALLPSRQLVMRDAQKLVPTLVREGSVRRMGSLSAETPDL